MVEIDVFAVRHTLDRLLPLLPPPPARILEAGCGRGALAAALGALGYRLTGVEPDDEACAAARARGVDVLQADIAEVPAEGGYDTVLFTRSMHHVDGLDRTVAHAVGLVAPSGVLVLEEFARERADRVAAGFVYDSRGLLVDAGVLVLPERVEPFDPDEDPADRWERERGVTAADPLHTGAAMLAALAHAGAVVEADVRTDTLWRMVVPHGSTWRCGDAQAGAVLESVRRVERRRIAEGTLPAVGMLVTARPGPDQSGGVVAGH
ncbi:MAG TPA: methyltransferase domain-containing protein [Mycobacteriales bacterium]|nr:methyltransferase domain-containing protein [Mycobacteriales bacterium]